MRKTRGTATGPLYETGLAELMVFYRERAAGFCVDTGNQDEGYFDALVRMLNRLSRPSANCPHPIRMLRSCGWIAYAS